MSWSFFVIHFHCVGKELQEELFLPPKIKQEMVEMESEGRETSFQQILLDEAKNDRKELENAEWRKAVVWIIMTEF